MNDTVNPSDGNANSQSDTDTPQSDTTNLQGDSSVQQAAAYSDFVLDLNRPVSDDVRAQLERYGVWFPNSLAVPPIIYEGKLPGWYDIGSAEFGRFVYPSQPSPLKTDPHFFQFKESASEFNNSVGELLQYIQSKTGLPIDGASMQEVEGFGYVFGDTLYAGFSSTFYQGIEMNQFVDILSDPDDGSVIVNVVYATVPVFEAWGGVFLPLVMNGYIEQPGSFTNRDVFLAGTNSQKTAFYSAMANTRLLSELSVFGILSASAQEAMQNAVTITDCAANSNCTITYVNGKAVATYN